AGGRRGSSCDRVMGQPRGVAAGVAYKAAAIAIAALVGGFAAAQPCSPDFIYEPELHRYQVLSGGLALTAFDDGRGLAVYAGLAGRDLRGAHVLRLTGVQAEPEGVGGPIGPVEITTLHALDADGPGPEAAHLDAGGNSGNRVWR